MHRGFTSSSYRISRGSLRKPLPFSTLFVWTIWAPSDFYRNCSQLFQHRVLNLSLFEPHLYEERQRSQVTNIRCIIFIFEDIKSFCKLSTVVAANNVLSCAFRSFYKVIIDFVSKRKATSRVWLTSKQIERRASSVISMHLFFLQLSLICHFRDLVALSCCCPFCNPLHLQRIPHFGTVILSPVLQVCCRHMSGRIWLV